MIIALRNKAFSLVELMVVIAIIGILSAIAVPSYKDYITKAKIAAAFPISDGLKQAVIDAYNIAGRFPANLTIGSLTIGNGTAYDAPPVVRLQYVQMNSGANAMLCVYLTGLSYSGYVAPTGTTWGALGRYCIYFSEVNSIIKTPCGGWPDPGYEIPFKYLPSSCQCTSLTGGSC